MRQIPILLGGLVLASTAAAAVTVDRIDPPHWWVGMKDTSLQLQVHGKDIRPAEFSVDYPGVRVDSVVRLDGSPDWQHVYLTIAPDTKPGTMTLKWKEGKKTVSKKYELRQRRPNGGAQGFISADVLYMIMPDRFADGDPSNNKIPAMNYPVGADRSNLNGRHGGDLKGIADHIDYIDSLGVTAVWLNPVLENDSPGGSYHGYATTDYYTVDRRFGSNADYAALIKALHDRGIKTIMDMIFNHNGAGHPWCDNPPSSDWFNFGGEYVQTNHKLSTITDPYASDYDRKLATDGWFVQTMPDLNQRNPHLMKYLIQNSIWWIEEAGIDGIRMDTYPYADSRAMAGWIDAVLQEYPGFNIVGECWFAQPQIEAGWQTGSRVKSEMLGDSHLPTVMDFPFMILNQNMAPYTEETDPWTGGLNKVYNHLSTDYIYADINKVLRFLDNHDTDRYTLTTPENLDAWKQGVALLLTLPGIPQLYYGTELLMEGDRKPGDGNVRRDMPGGFPGDKGNVFVREGRSDLQNRAFDFISRLNSWRKTNSAVADGKMKHFAPTNGVYLFTRSNDKDKYLVAVNGTDGELSLDMSRYKEAVKAGSRWRDVLTGREVVIVPEEGNFTFAPREILILEEIEK